MNANHSDVEGIILAGTAVTLYAGFMVALIFFDACLARRLHDWKTACYLESQRQRERVDRLMLMTAG